MLVALLKDMELQQLEVQYVAKEKEQCICKDEPLPRKTGFLVTRIEDDDGMHIIFYKIRWRS